MTYFKMHFNSQNRRNGCDLMVQFFLGGPSICIFEHIRSSSISFLSIGVLIEISSNRPYAWPNKANFDNCAVRQKSYGWASDMFEYRYWLTPKKKLNHKIATVFSILMHLHHEIVIIMQMVNVGFRFTRNFHLFDFSTSDYYFIRILP